MNLWLWRERYRRARDTVCIWIAAILPERVAYFGAMRIWAHATLGKYENEEISEVTMVSCLERWEADRLGVEKLPEDSHDRNPYHCYGCKKGYATAVSLTECDECGKKFCAECICISDDIIPPLCLGCIKDEVSIDVNDTPIIKGERIGMTDKHAEIERVAGAPIPTGEEVARALKGGSGDNGDS